MEPWLFFGAFIAIAVARVALRVYVDQALRDRRQPERRTIVLIVAVSLVIPASVALAFLLRGELVPAAALVVAAGLSALLQLSWLRRVTRAGA